jgi:23S rRNA maturation mini-RNase III
MTDFIAGETINLMDLPEPVARAILGDAVYDELVRQASQDAPGTYTVTAVEPDDEDV